MRLLDLSNSNRLLNYKFSNRSRRQVRLVDELPDKLVDKLKDGKRLTFKSLPEPDDEPEDEKSDDFILALEQAKRSDEEYLSALGNLIDDDEGEVSRRIERALCDRLRKTFAMPDRRLRDQIGRADWARRSGIEPSFDLPIPTTELKDSHLDLDLQTLLLPDEMEHTLSAINDQRRSSLQETGVNTLYLALGYLEWYEAPIPRLRSTHPCFFIRSTWNGKSSQVNIAIQSAASAKTTTSTSHDDRSGLPTALDTVELIGAKDMTRHDLASLADRLHILAGACAEASSAGGLTRHPWYGVRQALDYFARERFVEDIRNLGDGLGLLARALEEIGSMIESPVCEKIDEAQNLAEALKRLPRPAGEIDFELYAALEEPEALASLQAFEGEASRMDRGRTTNCGIGNRS